jgi:hypothetical protein
MLPVGSQGVQLILSVIRESCHVTNGDEVLRGHGAAQQAIRTPSTSLVSNAERTIREASHLIQPKVLIRRLAVNGAINERIMLEEGACLQGRRLAKHLTAASEVLGLLCTVGDSLEKLASKTMRADPVLGPVLEGPGSAGAEALADAACRRLEDKAKAAAPRTSIRLSPGMIGWAVDEGQPQILRLV